MIDTFLNTICRFLADLLIEFVFRRLFYWPGFALLRVVTIGRYPPQQNERHNREAVAVVGFISVVVLAVSMVMG